METENWQEKYEKLKEFLKGKWKGNYSECAAIANTMINHGTLTNNKQEIANED